MLNDIYRGLILVAPHGTYIQENTKHTIVKSVNFPDIAHKPLLLIEDKMAIGIIQLDNPKKINLHEFKNKYHEHHITEKERLALTSRWFRFHF